MRQLRERAWSLAFGLFDAGLAAAERSHLLPDRLDPDRLLVEARRRTGLAEFGDPDFLEPYRLLVRAYEEEAELDPLGRFVTRADTLRLLGTRLALVEERNRHPEIAAEEIRAPVVITGLPRTGTTLLHTLLSLDPSHRVPRTWEVMFPAGDGDPEEKVAEASRRLRWFDRMAPTYRRIHPVGPHLPQECIAITSHTFRSVRFHRTHHVPSYRRWLAATEAAPMYAWHRRFLQHLQWRRPGGRWVLKSPAHLFTLDALLAAYPDAKVVQCHRDPLTSLASNASQVRSLRGAFSARVERPSIDETVERWAGAVQRALELRDGANAGESRFVDVFHRELVGDPIRAVAELYERLGRRLPEAVEERIRDWIQIHPREEHGPHRYTLKEFGLDRRLHGGLFRLYRDRFGV